MRHPFPGPLAALLALASPLLAADEPTLTRVTPRRYTAGELTAVPRDGTRLLLHGAVFDPSTERPDYARVGLPPSGEPGYGIVQLRAEGLAVTRGELERRGVAFLGYLPENAFQVRLTPEVRSALSAHAGVRAVVEYAPGMKVQSRLWPHSPDAATSLTLQLFPGASPDDLESALRKVAPDLVLLSSRHDGERAVLRVAAPLSQRDALVERASRVAAVSWIEPYDEPRLHNNEALAPVQSNAATALAAGACTTCTIFGKGITGTGQIVTVADSGNDSDMCFFRKSAAAGDVTDAESPVPPAIGTLYPAKKIIAYWVQPGATAYDNNATCGSVPTSHHGTHTSGSAVGDNFSTLSTNVFPGVNTGDGMAPNAQLLFQDVGHDTSGCLAGLGDSRSMFLQAIAGGARVHSNSYGSDTFGAYTTDEQTADKLLFDREEMAILFSAGNSGSGGGSIGSPGNAKNVVTVGALGHGTSTSVASFSSRGPTDDGRIKPDIMAPGSSTISASGDTSHTSNNCGTKSLSGTSMSCPTVAGAAALLRQYFADGFYPTGAAVAANAFEAGAPLVKAVLLNGTLPLPAGSTFGGFDYGWGRVFLDSNLYFTGDGRELRVWNVPNTDGLTTGQSRTYQIQVAAGQELRVTLVWSDPEATLGAATALVNNLNLSVSNGGTYLGNVFGITGESILGGVADVTNNVEQVRLSSPAPATYTITVSAPAVPGNGRVYTNRQGFALVASYATCATTVTAAPTGLALASNATMGVDLTFTPALGSAVTQVYRAQGDCTTDPGEFQLVGQTAGSSFTDSRAQGGYAYAYRLRGADVCGEGPASACETITPAGRCDLVPTFDGLSSVAQSGALCRLVLTWGAATSGCPSGPAVRFNVYRSTTPGFIPQAGTLLTTVIGATTYDDDAVLTGTTYYYAVRAEDGTTGGSGPNGGNEENNAVQLPGTAFGVPGPATGTWTDNGGDTNAFLSQEIPWGIVSVQSQAGTRSYHPGPANGYPASTCASAATPALALGSGSVLTYYTRYNLEYQWDGVVVEISTDGGGIWSDLPPSGGYPAALSQTGNPPINACLYTASQGAFTGPSGNGSLTAWTQSTTNLSPTYDGKTVRIRWRFTTDPGTEYQGFYLDTIAVTNVFLPLACQSPLCPTITVSPASLPAMVVGAAFSQQMSASGGAGPFTFTFTGTLPPGLTLSPAGLLSGTPTQAGTFGFDIVATDPATCSGARAFAPTVTCPAVTVSPATLAAGTAGAAYSQNVTASGGASPYGFNVSVGTLPPSLTLSAGGALTGSPTLSGTFNFTVTATDTFGCTGSRPYSVTIGCGTVTLSPGTLPNAVAGTPYSQPLTAPGATGAVSFSIQSGALPAGLTLSSGGTISGTPTQSGPFNVTIKALDAAGCSGTQAYTLTVACPTITVTPASIAGATAGAPYNQVVSSTGGVGSVAYSLVGALPAGVTFSAGTFSGTPTVTGSFPVTVTATDANGCTGSLLYTLTVSCQTISVLPTTLNGGTAGTAYNQPFSSNGGIGTVTFGLTGTLPSGMTFVSGALGGTPTQTGSFAITVTATDANSCQGSRPYTLVVSCVGMTVQPSAFPAGLVGTPYNVSLGAAGSVGALTFEITAGSLPPGLTLTPSGAISGSPTQTGTFNLDVKVTDSVGCTASRSYSISVTSTNSAPTIQASGPFSRSRNLTTLTQLAVVFDQESPVASLQVTVLSTSPGLVVTDLTNLAGAVLAQLGATCDAPLGPGTVQLQVSDGNLTATTTASVTVTPNTFAPIVTPPATTTVLVSQTTCTPVGGARLADLQADWPAEFAALTALLASGSATDDCPPSPTRLPAWLLGADVTSTTVFPVGTSTVSLRFADADGNVGSTPVSVSVRRQGDVTADAQLDVNDLIAVANLIVGNLTAGTAPFIAPLHVGDTDGNGTIDVFDLVNIANAVVGNLGCLTPS